jgi:hypothetical protein
MLVIPVFHAAENAQRENASFTEGKVPQ